MCDFTCPNCKSENIQRFEVVYHSGLSHTTSNTVGMGAASGGLGLGAAQTQSNSVTSMAASVAPPSKQGYFKKFILLVIMSFIATLIFGSMNDTLGAIAGWATLIAGCYYWLYKKVYMFNKYTWPDMMEHWHHSYLCHKCGNRFEL